MIVIEIVLILFRNVSAFPNLNSLGGYNVFNYENRFMKQESSD